MAERPKVLWIDDEGLTALHELAGPVLFSNQYQLDFAVDASDALRKLLDTQYQVVVADVRLPSGNDPRFIDLHKRRTLEGRRNWLGIHLLEGCLETEGAKLTLQPRPTWLKADAVALFSVYADEDSVIGEAMRMGLARENIHPKGAEHGPEVLLRIIDRVLARQKVNQGPDHGAGPAH